MKLIRDLWKAIDAWCDEHGATNLIDRRRPGASEKALRALEKAIGTELPADLRASLAIHDGGGTFESYEYLGVVGIERAWRRWSDLHRSGKLAKKRIAEPRALKVWWDDGWIPFAEDSAGNLICADSARTRLVAVEVQDSQGVFAHKARSFGQWLRFFREKLDAGELAVDEEGFVNEPTVKPSVEPTAVAPPELAKKLSDEVEEILKQGDVAALKKLLASKRFTVHHTLIFERTLIGTAAEEQQLAMVAFLLERGADVNAGEARGKRTPLYWSLWGEGRPIAVAEFLLKKGARADAMTEFDGTPLHGAAMWGNAAAVKLLLAHGADPSRKDAKGQTPSEIAEDPAVKRLLTASSSRPSSGRRSTRKPASPSRSRRRPS
jgi:cell wall assembly regulator SMI1